MTYTIWSRDRLLGETDLEYERIFPLHRMGFFYPTEIGERLMPTACGVSPALRAFGDALDDSRMTSENQADGASDRGYQTTTEYADLAAAVAHEDGLRLELRDEKGYTIPTEHIHIIDTEYLIALGDAVMAREDLGMENDGFEGLDEEERRKLEAEIEAEVAEMLEMMEPDEPWQSEDARDWDRPAELPRYQVQVELINEFDVP